jgi:hypothetical protein
MPTRDQRGGCVWGDTVSLSLLRAGASLSPLIGLPPSLYAAESKNPTMVR